MATIACAASLLWTYGCESSGDPRADDDGASDADTDGDADTDADGDADGDSDTDADGDTDGDECGDVITAIVRDFSHNHPDFEMYFEDGPEVPTTGFVEPALGDDGKPVFVSSTGDGSIVQITSEATFDQWYNTVAGTNYEFEHEIQLTDIGDGVYEFDSDEFFPLSNTDGFGAEGYAFNFHFTTEVHLSFTYQGGEQFTFRGDDDLWLFIDGELAIDLGGLHMPAEDTVELDELGLEEGQDYQMDIFHAERHTEWSNFKITTTIECFEPVIE